MMITSQAALIAEMKNGAIVRGERGCSGTVYYNLFTLGESAAPMVKRHYIEPLIKTGEVEVFEMWAWRWAWRDR